MGFRSRVEGSFMKFGFSAALALCLSFTPALAADPVVDTCGMRGVIGAYGALGSSSGNIDSDVEGLGLYGKANFCDVLGTGLNDQTDVYGEFDKADNSAFGIVHPKSHSFGYVSHYYYRNDNYALGILSGMGQHTDKVFFGDESKILGVIGLDAHVYLDQLTLAGQFAYWDALGKKSFFKIGEAYEVSGEARYFLTDNFKLTGRLAYDWNTTIPDAYPWHGVSFGAGAEYQLDAYPVSIFANYTRTDGKITGNGFNVDQDSDVFKAGIVVHFNSNSLISEDRNGPTFATPMIDPWASLLATAWRED